MYTGIKRKRNELKGQKVQDKFKLLQSTQVEKNGYATNELIFKTKEFKQDPNIKYKDFEIANLMLAGIDVNALPKTSLGINVEALDKQAEQAESYLDRIEILNEIEHESNTEQTQQQEQ